MAGAFAEVFPPGARAVREFAAEAEGAFRIGLPLDHAGSVACRLRDDWDQGRGEAADPEGQRRAAVRARPIILVSGSETPFG